MKIEPGDTTEQLENRWIKQVEDIYGDAWSIRYDALPGNEDDLMTN